MKTSQLEKHPSGLFRVGDMEGRSQMPYPIFKSLTLRKR
ncbi:hypothetical protein NBRC3257_2411 [Gluconobacter thailandicus NBRC 3257]|uniref:Uncharacterized protein n=1 Tax=Gluconobacter thailandicus NBRC 3257 TaxID=1381097 RepID=A0ABQ0IYX4_GLUTH|nr:hypothetical protein B932_3504 [Gluconobacter oxydans H24]GAC87067.1 hypothetical protein NBRC3255_0728 [Gluconobacter thailandicus NBRC 3255]GAD27412.1 hypothetical protein NBRC3257_2411 [Gluconobacter thailandicus NBRC 3257]